MQAPLERLPASRPVTASHLSTTTTTTTTPAPILQANLLVLSLQPQAAQPPAAPAPAAASVSGARSGAPPLAPLFRAGHVLRHAKHGYRAVIVGWDESCRAAPEWVAASGARALRHGLAQPFYYALVDQRDRPGCAVAYIAQDLVHLLSAPHPPPHQAHAGQAEGGGHHHHQAPPPAAASLMHQLAQHAQQHQLAQRLVMHPLISAHFAAFDPLEGVFVARSSSMDDACKDDSDKGAAPAALVV
jgi:hypothetical protein